MNKIPKVFQKYFWDTNPARIDLKKHQTYVIERLLEYGDTHAYKWLKKKFPKNILSKIASKSRRISSRTKNFWQVIS